MVSRPPKINTLSLLFFQRFLLVNKYGTKRVRPEKEQRHFTMWKQIWNCTFQNNVLSIFRQLCLTSIIRDPVDVNALPALFRLKHWSDLLIWAIVRNILMGSQKRSFIQSDCIKWSLTETTQLCYYNGSVLIGWLSGDLMFSVFVNYIYYITENNFVYMCHLNSGRSRPFHIAGLHLHRMPDCQLQMICLQTNPNKPTLDLILRLKLQCWPIFKLSCFIKHTCTVQIIRYVQSIHHSQNRDAVAGVERIAE